MYYAVHTSGHRAKTFDTIGEARAYAQRHANAKNKQIEIDKIREMDGEFSSQSHHSYVKPHKTGVRIMKKVRKASSPKKMAKPRSLLDETAFDWDW